MVIRMSDPVSHAEIEDVLSSIRRLVSEDNSNKPAAPEPAARLVLTPALRVQEPDASALPAQAEQNQAADADLPLDSQIAQMPEPSAQAENGAVAAAPDFGADPPIAFHRRAPQATDAATETASEPISEHTEPLDQAEVLADPSAPWGNPDTTLFAAADAAQQPDPSEGAAADDSAAVQPDTPVAPASASGRAASVLRQLAEMEARNPPAPQWEPDNRSEPPFAGIDSDSIEWRDEPLIASRSLRDSAADVVDIKAEATDAAADHADSDNASSLMDAAGDTENLAEAVVTDVALEALTNTDDAEAADTYLDEDALRDLVASIVREELQGPLGERITRNVRKLVRREIHRALAAHDLL